MTAYTVHMTAHASVSIDVDVDEEAVRTVLGPHADDPDAIAEAMREAAIEAAYDNAPSTLCAECSGWHQKWGCDIGDWELLDEKYGPAVTRREGQ